MENSTSDYNDDIYSGLVPLEDADQFGSLFCAVCYSLIFSLSLPANSYLFWALLRWGDLGLASDILLLHLTASDLLFTLSLPFWAVYHLHGWVFGEFACRLLSGAFFLGLYSYMSFITALTVDRYVAVVHAVSVSVQIRRWLCVHLCSAGLWLVCVAASLMEVLFTKTEDGGDDGVLCVDASPSLSMELLGIYIQIGLFFLLPFAVITFCYVRIWVTIRHCRLRGRHQAIRLIFGIMVGFFVCWAPYNVLVFLHSIKLLKVDFLATANWGEALQYAYYISHTLAYCHCCLNPLFHVFGGERFRRYLPLFCGGTSSSGTGRTEDIQLSEKHPATFLPDRPVNIE